MESAVLLRIIIFAMGIILLMASVYSLSRRRMTEPFCLAWGFVALMLIVAGLLLKPTEWRRYISGSTMTIVLLVGFCVGWGAFFISTKVSELMRKNLELAMQVTLLNQEREEIRSKLEELLNGENREQTGDLTHADVIDQKKTEV